MRILLLLNARFPTEKAYGIQTITMAEGYAALGHQVAIAYPRRTKEEPKPIKGVEFLPFGALHQLIFPWLFHPFRILGVRDAMSAIRSFRPDIVIANDPLQTLILAKRVPMLWELHDVPDMKRLSRRMLLKRLLRRVAGIVSTNQLKLDALSALGALPPAVVSPNAVTFDPEVYRGLDRNTVRRELNLPNSEKTIVYAGQLFHWKGVDTLISSAPYLSSDHVIHLIGGTGADLERSQALAKTLPPSAAKVVFHGLRPKEEIPMWLRAATIVVIPNSGKFEVSVRDTSPLKLFEAFAAGAAIVASDLPSIREIVGKNQGVRWVSPDDAQHLAHVLSGLTDAEIALMRNASETYSLQTASMRARVILDFVASLKGSR